MTLKDDKVNDILNDLDHISNIISNVKNGTYQISSLDIAMKEINDIQLSLVTNERQFTYEDGYEDGIESGKDECIDLLSKMDFDQYDRDTICEAIQMIKGE